MVIVTLVTFRNIQTAHQTVASEISITSRISNRDTIYIEDIIVETNNQRIGHSIPFAVGIAQHGIFLATDIYLHITCFGSMQTEISTMLGINARKFVAFNS